MLRFKINSILKNKKTAWELIEKIPETPEQKKIDREIAVIEKNYEKNKKKKLNQMKNKSNNKKEKISKTHNNKKKSNVKKRCSYKKNNLKNYGKNAGKIWNELNKHGPLNKSLILKDTKLSSYDFYVGIGWLAREDKICQDTGVYKLGNTNLTYEIGENAGKIWNVLNYCDQANISDIQKITKIKINDVYSAIGWLSRENKIKLVHKNKDIYYKLT